MSPDESRKDGFPSASVVVLGVSDVPLRARQQGPRTSGAVTGNARPGWIGRQGAARASAAITARGLGFCGASGGAYFGMPGVGRERGHDQSFSSA